MPAPSWWLRRAASGRVVLRALLGLADARLERSWYLMKARAGDLGGGWARMWDEGVGDRIRRAHVWLRRERAALDDALR